MTERGSEEDAAHVAQFEIRPGGTIQFTLVRAGHELVREFAAGTTALTLLLHFMGQHAPAHLAELANIIQRVGLSPVNLFATRSSELIHAFNGAKFAAFSLDLPSGTLQLMGSVISGRPKGQAPGQRIRPVRTVTGS
ncbi:hypothetical protein GCM10008957_27350 [Deinococcus ruber]|uniref:Uncharacterized protein n=2 Tax=Deinococcus ruber TaxID=1848197 RepID=A0A918F947_9DEIO|nr:hypothetical protein GCM10008957_27350 [Deinococcus ruber]